MTAQEIYEDIKNADNKKLWAYAQKIAEFQRKADKDSQIQSSLDQIDFNDTESMRQALFTHLYKESDRGNAQASDKLGKYLGLENRNQDIIIQIVDFANAYTEEDITTTT